MKANLSQKAMKLGPMITPNDNWELLSISELNSSCLFQTERDLTPIFPC